LAVRIYAQAQQAAAAAGAGGGAAPGGEPAPEGEKKKSDQKSDVVDADFEWSTKTPRSLDLWVGMPRSSRRGGPAFQSPASKTSQPKPKLNPYG